MGANQSGGLVRASIGILQDSTLAPLLQNQSGAGKGPEKQRRAK